MRKYLLIALLTMGGATFGSAPKAQTQVPMQVIKTGASSNAGTQSPARPWYITQDDYVLTLPELADDYSLELRDEYDAVVYSTFLTAGTTSVILPSTLTGDFEIRLVADTYYYRGYISL